MLESVIKNYKDYFAVILKCMWLVFFVDVKEVDTTGHSYILVTSLGLSYDGLLGDDQSKPKAGLQIIVAHMCSCVEGPGEPSPSLLIPD